MAGPSVVICKACKVLYVFVNFVVIIMIDIVLICYTYDSNSVSVITEIRDSEAMTVRHNLVLVTIRVLLSKSRQQADNKF